MAEDDGVTGGPAREVPPEPRTGAEPEAAATAAPVLKSRWRDRAWSFRAMLAVAAASLVIGGVVGGVVGVVVGAVAGGDHDHGRYSRMGPWGPGMNMPPGWRGRGHGGHGGGPGWRWNDGPQQAPSLSPYGGTTPSAPTTPTPSAPGSTG